MDRASVSPSPHADALLVYRLQGRDATWWDDIKNSDVADAAGEACFLAHFDPEQFYPPNPIVAEYAIETFPPYAPYIECPECATPPCPERAPNRTCHGSGSASSTKVGRGRCNVPSGAAGNGTWYSLPLAGACKHPDDVVGVDCFWKVRHMRKTVDLECVRKAGCAPTTCTADQFQTAFDTCADLALNAPKCHACHLAYELNQHYCAAGSGPAGGACSPVCTSHTGVPRIAYAPSECFDCFDQGRVWTLASDYVAFAKDRNSLKGWWMKYMQCIDHPPADTDIYYANSSQCSVPYGQSL